MGSREYVARALGEGLLSDLAVVCLALLAAAGPVAGGIEIELAGRTIGGPPTWLAGMAWLTLLAYRSAWRQWGARWPRRTIDLLTRHGVALGLLAIFAGGLWLRIRGIDFGLPLIVHPDEPSAAGVALDMLRRGSFDPGWYIYPTLYMYLLLPGLGLYYVYGRGNGLFSSLADSTRAEGGFYLVGRYYSAVLGALTPLLTFSLARALWGRDRGSRVGLGAAVLVAASFIHVRESHHAVTDVAAAAMTTAALIAIAKVLGPGRTRDYAAAGLLTGLAGSTKYTALPLVVSILAAHLMGRAPREWLSRRAALAVAMLPVGFVFGSPYAVLNWRPFLEHLGWLDRYSGAADAAGARAQFFHVVGYMAESGFGAVAFAALVVALGLAARRRRAPELLLAVTLIAFFPQWTQTTHPFFARFLLPVVPVVALLIASLFEELAGWLERRRWWSARVPSGAILALLVLAAAGSPLRESVWLGSYLARPDSRTAAYEEIAAAAPGGAVIATEAPLFRLPPEYTVLDWRPLHSHAIPEFITNRVQFVLLDERRDSAVSPRERGAEIRERIRRRFEEVARFSGDPGPPIIVYRVPEALLGTEPPPAVDPERAAQR